MITWVKPNGLEIETNDVQATIEFAESLGWVRTPTKRALEDKPTRKRRSKSEIAEDKNI